MTILKHSSDYGDKGSLLDQSQAPELSPRLFTHFLIKSSFSKNPAKSV